MLGNRCSLYQEMWAAGGRKKKIAKQCWSCFPGLGDKGKGMKRPQMAWLFEQLRCKFLFGADFIECPKLRFRELSHLSCRY